MKAIDLFAGCGGLSLGLQNSGIDIVQAYDNWEKSNEIYQKNFEHPIQNIDLSNTKESIKHITKFEFDLIAGGPPCQDFSSAGKRDVSLGRADLTYKFTEIVMHFEPSWFVMENVPLIKNSFILKDVIKDFRKKYGLTAITLDASYFGVPQSRKRFFLIGRLQGKHNELVDRFKMKCSSKPMTVREYLGNSLNTEYYYRHPRNYNRRGIFSVDEPSPTVRGVNRPIPPEYEKKGIMPEGVSIEEVRSLTSRERSYIQTFPKDFILDGPKTHLELMIGNSVPVNLAKVVGEIILNFKEFPVDIFDEDNDKTSPVFQSLP